jgi:phosphoenolpyruvate carboxykinase (ATP)
MPRHPTVYAELLGQKMREHRASCWLLNTGWSGGGAATGGKRMPLKATRALLHAALDGSLDRGRFRVDPVFGLEVPEACPGVESRLLVPRDAWPDKAAYDAAAREVAGLFEKNFEKFAGRIASHIESGAIRAAA